MTVGTNKLTRAEKNERTRANLLDAAAWVVGEKGYRDASVADITERARVAQGTFYNYFESKQDILDQLLPELGERLLEFLGRKVGESTFLEREERSLQAYFEFVREHPEFYRILTEAHVYAPDSFARHYDNLMRNYANSLKKTKENGFLQDYEIDELEAIASILLGARVYLMGHFSFRRGKPRAVPQRVVDTFIKVIRFGLGGTSAEAGRRMPIKAAARPQDAAPQPRVIRESGDERVTLCRTPDDLVDAGPAAAYAFMQHVCTGHVEAWLDAWPSQEMAVSAMSLQLTPAQMPVEIVASSVLEHQSEQDGLVRIRIAGADDNVCLAVGQASLCRRAS